jgi:hypothetical protein
VLRHLVAGRKAPERAGQGQQGLGRFGLAPGLDDGSLRIERRRGEPGVGLEHRTLTPVERVELGAYGNQVPVVTPLRGNVAHEDMCRRFALRLAKRPGHCRSFGLVETLGTYETIGAGTRLDVENELRGLDRTRGSGQDAGEHMRQAVTRPEFRHRTLQFGQSGLQQPDLHVGSSRLGFAPFRSIPTKAGGAAGIAVALARLVADVGDRESEELRQGGGHAQPERAELSERLVRRNHHYLHPALIWPHLLRRHLERGCVESEEVGKRFVDRSRRTQHLQQLQHLRSPNGVEHAPTHFGQCLRSAAQDDTRGLEHAAAFRVRSPRSLAVEERDGP